MMTMDCGGGDCRQWDRPENTETQDREGERSLQTIYGAQETTEGQRGIEVRMKQKQTDLLTRRGSDDGPGPGRE